MRSLRSSEILSSPARISTKPGQAVQKEMKANMDIHQEKMETAMHSIRSELEETIKYRVEDVLSCVDQKTQCLRKKPTEKITEHRWTYRQ
jgi:hypothetical protein